MRSQPSPRPLRAVLLATATLAAIHGAPAAAQDDPAAYIGGRLGTAYAQDARFDAALMARARAARAEATMAGVDAEYGVVLQRVEASFGKQLRDIGVDLKAAGMPVAAFQESITHQAWRRATIRAILLAEAPAPSEADLHRRFEEKYGPAGVRRTYREVYFSLDPVMSRLISREDIARRLPEAQAAARKLAEQLMADIVARKATVETGVDRGAVVRSIDVLQDSDPRAVAAAKVGVPFIANGPEGIYVAVADKLLDSARIEGVKVTIIPRKGEDADQVQARLRAATEALLAADDPAIVALDTSDDEDDRRNGGVIRGGFNIPDSAQPASARTERSNAPPAILAAMAAVGVGEITQPVPWKKGYAVARVTKKDRVGQPRAHGDAACFRCDENAVRMRLLGKELESVASAHAADVYDRARRGESLARMAATEGEKGDEETTGGIAVFPIDFEQPEFHEALLALPVGGQAQILRSNRGYHVIQCAEQTVTRYEDVAAELARPDARTVQEPDIARVYGELWEKAR